MQMATRGMIGVVVEKENNRIRAIYNHFDSYPEHLGKVLAEHYSDRDVCETLCTYHTRSISPDGVPEYEDGGDDPEYRDYGTFDLFIKDARDRWGVEYIYLLDKDGWQIHDVYANRTYDLDDILATYEDDALTY